MSYFLQQGFDRSYTQSPLASDASPLKLFSQPGHPNIWIVAGDNATGKSFFMKQLAQRIYSDFNTEPMEMSMRSRTKEGMQRAMVWGAEANQSTGELSVKTSLKALNSMHGRMQDGHNAFVILDEPDIGLSDGYRYSFGHVIGDRLLQLPESTRNQWGVVIVTHSRQLVQGLLDAMGDSPTFVHTQEEKTLHDWLHHIPQYSPEQILGLNEKSKQFSRQLSSLETVIKQQAYASENAAFEQQLSQTMEQPRLKTEDCQTVSNLYLTLRKPGEDTALSLCHFLLAWGHQFKDYLPLNRFVQEHNQLMEFMEQRHPAMADIPGFYRSMEHSLKNPHTTPWLQWDEAKKSVTGFLFKNQWQIDPLLSPKKQPSPKREP